jgi:hypothetical protein
MAGTPFWVPSGPVVPLLVTAIIVWLLSNLAPGELAAAVSFVLAGIAFYGSREILRLRARK